MKIHLRRALNMLCKSFIAAGSFSLITFFILVSLDGYPRRKIMLSAQDQQDPLDLMADQAIYGSSSAAQNSGQIYSAEFASDAAQDPDIVKMISESQAIGARVDDVTSHNPYAKSPYSASPSTDPNQVIKIKFHRSIRPTQATVAALPVNIAQSDIGQHDELDSSKQLRIARIQREDESASGEEVTMKDTAAWNSDPRALDFHKSFNPAPQIVNIPSPIYMPVAALNNQRRPSPQFVPIVAHPKAAGALNIVPYGANNHGAKNFVSAGSNKPIPLYLSHQRQNIFTHRAKRYRPGPNFARFQDYPASASRPEASIYSSTTRMPDISGASRQEQAAPAHPRQYGDPDHSRASWSLRVPGPVTVDHIVLPGGTYGGTYDTYLPLAADTDASDSQSNEEVLV